MDEVRDGADVLVVEDDFHLRKSFSAILRNAGYRVTEAENGSVALEHLRSEPVGVVLLDIAMPVLDGLALLDRLENHPPVVLITAHDYDEAVMARQSKVSMYLQKPVPPANLLEAVAHATASCKAG